jgi:signal transduction histidine kinase
LDVSKIQTGKLTLVKEQFSLTDLIQEIVKDMQDSTDNHSLVFNSKYTVKVVGDRFRIYQVLTNLLTNAIKYSPNGGEIKVGLKKETNKVIVSVQDKGIGYIKSRKERKRRFRGWVWDYTFQKKL